MRMGSNRPVHQGLLDRPGSSQDQSARRNDSIISADSTKSWRRLSGAHVKTEKSSDDDFLGARASRPHKAWHNRGYLSEFDQPGRAPLLPFRPADGVPAYWVAACGVDGLADDERHLRAVRRTPAENLAQGSWCGSPETGGGGRVGRKRMRAGRPRSQGMTPAARWGTGGRLLNNLTCTQSRDPRLPRTERRGRRPAEPGQACRITSGIVDAVGRRFLGRTGTTIAESILPAFTDGSALEKPLQPTRL